MQQPHPQRAASAAPRYAPTAPHPPGSPSDPYPHLRLRLREQATEATERTRLWGPSPQTHRRSRGRTQRQRYREQGAWCRQASRCARKRLPRRLEPRYETGPENFGAGYHDHDDVSGHSDHRAKWENQDTHCGLRPRNGVSPDEIALASAQKRALRPCHARTVSRHSA